MLIPLDYYRILGLPIQATAEQVELAHRDRVRQMPRREYSEIAIRQRKQLIDEAFSILLDAEDRSRYDAKFLAKTYELESPSAATAQHSENGTASTPSRVEHPTPTLEIEDDPPIGALILLQELGEYELVLKLGRPYLGNSATPDEEQSGFDRVVRSDIVLVVALAYLELGREQWQQSQYKKAAVSLEAGQALLLRESLFPNIRGEMQEDLYKLRPYRILELVALPLEQNVERQQGLQLLRDMLQERGGIDGAGDDRSGLDIDDFLRFVQQLRRYTTVAEQQLLFEREARRPSAVATYLCVYALIGRGFAERQPGLIQRAKLMLIQLGRRQDVHLEQSICSLLLGQTETASRALELSQEEDTLNFIREHSRESEDLLPGLCLYAERWLQEEVFPHFRDLATVRASLTVYFADEQVQAHLEAMPNEAQMSNQWVVSGMSAVARRSLDRPVESIAVGDNAAGSTSTLTANPPQVSGSVDPSWQVSPTSATIPPVEPVSGGVTGSVAPPTSLPFPSVADTTKKPPIDSRVDSRLRRPRRSRSLNRGRLALVVGAGLLSLFLLLFLLGKIFGLLANAVQALTGPSLNGEQLAIVLNKPPVEIPPPQSVISAPTGDLTQETARQAIETWLNTKKAAFGSAREIGKLSDILVDPALGEWRQRAERDRAAGIYRQYEHSVKIDNVTVGETDKNRATVVAQVREKVTAMQGNTSIDSSDDDLSLRYELVRQNDRWFIRNWTWEVLN
ncbi:MAG: IMS domain-containing protein [Geitlerinemataceae cyanobacterium]